MTVPKDDMSLAITHKLSQIFTPSTFPQYKLILEAIGQGFAAGNNMIQPNYHTLVDLHYGVEKATPGNSPDSSEHVIRRLTNVL